MFSYLKKQLNREFTDTVETFQDNHCYYYYTSCPETIWKDEDKKLFFSEHLKSGWCVDFEDDKNCKENINYDRIKKIEKDANLNVDQRVKIWNQMKDLFV